MALEELLNQIRDYYVNQFVSVVNEQAEDAEYSTAHETAFVNESGEVVVEGQLGLPYRGDVMRIQAGVIVDSIQVDTEEMLGFEPLEFTWPDSELTIKLQPFQWNWLQLQLYGLPRDANWQPMCDWFMHWFQEHDPPGDELLGGVHYLSDPIVHESYSQVAIDLGTAPVEALEELIDAVGQMQASELRIGQFSDDVESISN